MTRFIDGPAEGVSLMLQRSLVFLRVVHDRSGKWDALDQLEDTPKNDERILVYFLEDLLGFAHYNFGPKGGCRCQRANYKLYDPQPEDSRVRETEAWAQWVMEAAKREGLA